MTGRVSDWVNESGSTTTFKQPMGLTYVLACHSRQGMLLIRTPNSPWDCPKVTVPSPFMVEMRLPVLIMTVRSVQRPCALVGAAPSVHVHSVKEVASFSPFSFFLTSAPLGRSPWSSETEGNKSYYCREERAC